MCQCTPEIKSPYCGRPGCEWPQFKPSPPATPAQAEDIAKKLVGDYLTACRLGSSDPASIGNYLMKLVSVAGVMMANAEGSEVAFDRLLGVAQFVHKTMPKQPSTLRTIQ